MIDEWKDWLFQIFMAALAGFASIGVWFVREVLTNGKRIGLLEAAQKNRDQLRSEDREVTAKMDQKIDHLGDTINDRLSELTQLLTQGRDRR